MILILIDLRSRRKHGKGVAVCLDSKKDSYKKINYFMLFSAIFFYFSSIPRELTISTTLSPKNLDNPNGSSILFQTQNPFFSWENILYYLPVNQII